MQQLAQIDYKIRSILVRLIFAQIQMKWYTWKP